MLLSTLTLALAVVAAGQSLPAGSGTSSPVPPQKDTRKPKEKEIAPPAPPPRVPWAPTRGTGTLRPVGQNKPQTQGNQAQGSAPPPAGQPTTKQPTDEKPKLGECGKFSIGFGPATCRSFDGKELCLRCQTLYTTLGCDKVKFRKSGECEGENKDKCRQCRDNFANDRPKQLKDCKQFRFPNKKRASQESCRDAKDQKSCLECRDQFNQLGCQQFDLGRFPFCTREVGTNCQKCADNFTSLLSTSAPSPKKKKDGLCSGLPLNFEGKFVMGCGDEDKKSNRPVEVVPARQKDQCRACRTQYKDLGCDRFNSLQGCSKGDPNQVACDKCFNLFRSNG